MHFLNAYICLDLGQEESPKAWKILVIKFLALLRPVVLRHMEQLLLVTSCDSPAGIGASLRTDGRTDGQTDVTLEIVF